MTDRRSESSQRKRQVRVALVSLFVAGNNGVRFLAANLRKEGVETLEIYLKDFEYHHYPEPTQKEIDLLLEILRTEQVGLVGISVRAGVMMSVAVAVTRRIKDELGLPVMWGGTHPTMAPEECIEYPDFMVLGEADEAIVDIARAFEQGNDVATLDNVMLKRDGAVISNPIRHPRDLDALPLRDYHSHDYKYWINRNRVTKGDPVLNERIYLMITSRGCLFKCAYCNVSLIRTIYDDCGSYFRYHSVEAVMEELEVAKKTFPKLKRIRFDDQIFIPKRDWIEEFALEYPKRIGLPFEVLSDPRICDEWTIETLARVGLDRTLIGIQSVETANRRLYDRPVSDEQIVDLGRHMKKNGVLASFQVIVDDPETTFEEKERLIEVLLAIPRPFDLYIFSLCHWPGTTRTRRLLADGLITQDQIEGYTGKARHQFLADFSWPRPAEDNFFLALYQLTNKRGIPRGLVRRLARSRWLRRHPWPLIAVAKVLSLTKFFAMGFGMVLRGEVSGALIRRWLYVLFSPSI